MEPIVLVLILALVGFLVLAGAVAVARGGGRSAELEPPPTPKLDERSPTGRLEPPLETAEPVEADQALIDQVEEALAEAPVVEEVVAPARPRFRDRLSKARGLFAGYVGSILSRSAIDDETWEELEEALARADVGMSLTTEVLDDLRARVKSEGIKDPQELIQALKDDLKKSLASADRGLRYEPGAPNVWLFVGVNGVGKTTTIGKVAKKQQEDGRKVILAAGDTFRAAAGEQLEMWATRVGADIVRGAEGGDPASVIFDAVQRAGARGFDIVLGDTAGRLHTKVNLMEELKKVRRVAEREPGRVTEVLLVIDATTGQNGLVQAKQFTDAVAVTGVVLTKLDGTAKGGIALAIEENLNIPIKLIGVGEGIDDMEPFDPKTFVDALLA